MKAKHESALTARLPMDVHRRTRAAARDAGVSLSAYVRAALERAIARPARRAGR